MDKDIFRALIKMAIKQAKNITDDTEALGVKILYPKWKINVNYEVGQYVNYNNTLYKVLTAHTSQEGWTPVSAPSLFAKALTDPTGETILAWEQPNSTNPYMKGDKVTHNGKTWVSTCDNNVWEPGVYGWEEAA